MSEVELVKGDREADAMLLCAVQWVMREEIDKTIRRFSELVPVEIREQFIDYVAETNFTPYRWGELLKKEHAGSPNLYGDEAYRDYVRKVMGVAK